MSKGIAALQWVHNPNAAKGNPVQSHLNSKGKMKNEKWGRAFKSDVRNPKVEVEA